MRTSDAYPCIIICDVRSVCEEKKYLMATLVFKSCNSSASKQSIYEVRRVVSKCEKRIPDKTPFLSIQCDPLRRHPQFHATICTRNWKKPRGEVLHKRYGNAVHTPNIKKKTAPTCSNKGSIHLQKFPQWIFLFRCRLLTSSANLRVASTSVTSQPL